MVRHSLTRTIPVLWLLGVVGSGVGTAQAPLTVMTFNIRYGTAEDGDNRWERRRDLLFEVIRTENADIVGLQEALRFQIRRSGRTI